MKKLIVLGFAVLCIFGIQSCSIDEQEGIAPQKNTTTEITEVESHKSSGLTECRKTIYVNFGDMSESEKSDFRKLAKNRWYISIVVEETLCTKVERWSIPCARFYKPRNDEGKNVVVDAEESVATLNDGGSVPPYSVRPPKFEPSNFNLIVCTTPPNPITITDGDDDDDVGDSPIGIPLNSF